MGCGASMDNAVLPLPNDMDAQASKSHKKFDASKCLAGKFQRVELAKEVWVSRMATFIYSHVKQIQNFSATEYEVMLARLAQYRKSIGPNPIKKDKHTHAISTLEMVFAKPIHPSTLAKVLIGTSVDYCESNQEHHFEEIMFVFTIIVHAPTMRYFETTY